MPDTLRTIFDHIPKTGGTSITAALQQSLGDQNVVQVSLSPHNVVVASAGSRRALCGHLWFYPGERLVCDWFYATLLRDPVDRALSEYYFHRQLVLDGARPDSDSLVAASAQDDLEGYFLDKRSHVAYNYLNVQAVHFAQRMCENPYELSRAQLLDAAITGLKDYDLVGVYTDIEKFLKNYCDALRVPRQELPMLNVTRARRFARQLSEDIQGKLIAMNTVDLALIDWVRHQYSLQRSPATRAAAAGHANFGTREIEIRSIECRETRRAEGVVRYGERIHLRLGCRSDINEADLTAGIIVHNSVGQEVLGANSKRLGVHLIVQANSEFVIRIEFNACLAVGDYQISLSLIRGLHHLDRCFHWVSGVDQFRILPGQTDDGDPRSNPEFYGTESQARVTFAIEGTPRPRRWWRKWQRASSVN